MFHIIKENQSYCSFWYTRMILPFVSYATKSCKKKKRFYTTLSKAPTMRRAAPMDGGRFSAKIDPILDIDISSGQNTAKFPTIFWENSNVWESVFWTRKRPTSQEPQLWEMLDFGKKSFCKWSTYVDNFDKILHHDLMDKWNGMNDCKWLLVFSKVCLWENQWYNVPKNYKHEK